MDRRWSCVALSAVLALSFATLGCGRRAEQDAPIVDVRATQAGADETSNDAAASGLPSGESPGFAGWLARAPRETWDVIYLRGSKVGYTHTTIDTTRQGTETFIEIAAEHRLEVLRFGQPTRQTLFVSSSEREDGAFLTGAVQIMSDGAPSEAIRFDRTDEGLRVTKTAAGTKESALVPFTGASAGLYGLEESLFARPMKPGEERTVHYLMPVINEIVEARMIAFAPEEAELLGGEKRTLTRIEATQNVGGTSIVTVMWVDDSGQSLKSYVPAMDQATYRATEEIALREEERVELDLGLDFVAKAKLPAPETLREAIFDVYVDDADAAEIFPQSGAQRVESLPGGGARVYVRRIDPNGRATPSADSIPPTPADKTSSSLVQSDDPAIQAFAMSVAPEESDSWKTAIGLERAVHESIESKNLSKAFLSAADVLKSREGDCTEHAVLLAAALRARGIPAKLAIGLTYVSGFEGFAYHMWTEAWIDDRWIPLDATTARGGAAPSYLKLADTSLAGAGPYAAFLPAVKVLGRLRVETTGVTLLENE